jgi:hypothetical protein
MKELDTAISPPNALQMAIKSVNDTTGSDGLVPTLLVFGAYPKLMSQSQATTTAARATAIRKIMTKVRKLKARRNMAIVVRTRKGPDITNTLEFLIPSEVKV